MPTLIGRKYGSAIRSVEEPVDLGGGAVIRYTENVIEITESAAKRIRAAMAKEGVTPGGLRVGVKGGGCSGLTYTLSIDREPQADDRIVEDQGIRLFIPKKSYVFLAGTTLEYSGGLNGKGFVFNNPNAKTTCGCGTSFGV